MTTVLTKKEIEMIKERIEDRVAGWVQTYADTITKNYRDSYKIFASKHCIFHLYTGNISSI